MAADVFIKLMAGQLHVGMFTDLYTLRIAGTKHGYKYDLFDFVK
jgi:hypothetical protein